MALEHTYQQGPVAHQTRENEMADRYEVIDSRTNEVVGNYKNRDAAYRFADRKDHAFGAVRFIVKPIWA